MRETLEYDTSLEAEDEAGQTEESKGAAGMR